MTSWQLVRFLAGTFILLSLALLWIALKVVPVLVQGLVNLIKFPFRKAGVIR